MRYAELVVAIITDRHMAFHLKKGECVHTLAVSVSPHSFLDTDFSDVITCCVQYYYRHSCSCLSHSFLYANLKELSLALVSNR